MFVIKSNNLRLNAKFNLLQLNKLLFAISKNVTFLGNVFFLHFLRLNAKNNSIDSNNKTLHLFAQSTSMGR